MTHEDFQKTEFRHKAEHFHPWNREWVKTVLHLMLVNLGPRKKEDIGYWRKKY